MKYCRRSAPNAPMPSCQVRYDLKMAHCAQWCAIRMVTCFASKLRSNEISWFPKSYRDAEVTYGLA